MVEEVKVEGLDELLDAIKEGAGEGLPSMEGKHLGDALIINQEEDFEPSGYGWETVNFVPTPLLASPGQVLTVKEEDDVKTYGWENAPASGEVYSTSEVVVGTWTDGRPVYQKVYTATISGNTSTGIPHGLYGIADQIVSVDGIVKAGTGYYKLGDLRTIDNGQVANAIGIANVMLQDLGNIGIFAGRAYTGWSLTFTVYLRYTKSADLQS